MKQNIESFFEYKWKNDKNMVFNDDQELQFYNQMPVDV